jgi:hypothetical protein
MADRTIKIDVKRGRAAADLLYRVFSTTGIRGHSEMPEDTLPAGVSRGSLEHLLFITLTVSIDYQRDAVALWKSSRLAFQDPGTCYLFDPDLFMTQDARRSARICGDMDCRRNQSRTPICGGRSAFHSSRNGLAILGGFLQIADGTHSPCWIGYGRIRISSGTGRYSTFRSSVARRSAPCGYACFVKTLGSLT